MEEARGQSQDVAELDHLALAEQRLHLTHDRESGLSHDLGLEVDLEVDGGIDEETAAAAAAAGANVFVAGTAVFGHAAPWEAVDQQGRPAAGQHSTEGPA